MITQFEDIRVGHWITFRSQIKSYLDGETPFEEPVVTIQRKFYEIIDIKDEKLFCKTYIEDISNKRPKDFHDTVIDNVFKNPDGDEVFESFEELKLAYAEEFI